MYDACSLPIFTLQMQVDHLAFEMMIEGIPVSTEKMHELEQEVEAEKEKRFAIIKQWLPDAKRTLPRSTKQMAELFVSLGLRPGSDRTTHRPTYDNEVLWSRCKIKPKLAPLLIAIMEYRTLAVMQTTLKSKRDPDGKWRCSFNTAGPETFRWSSSKNPFGRGLNLQNVAKPFHNLTGCPLPNLRRAIVPPAGCLLWEPDLAGADAQIVAWDSGDPLMKEVFRKGVKLHAVRAKEIFGASAGPDGKTEPYYTLAKKGGHLWNYGGKAKTMATSLGITVADADSLIRRLEGLHPAIVQWHRRIEDQIKRTRTVTNAFGYRIVYFGRTDDLLPDALAWIGQGTVACVANRVALNIRNNLPVEQARLLLQEHDSLVGVTPVELWGSVAPLIREQFMRVVVPYAEPLVIPPSLKTSASSWGEMEGETWND